MGVPKLRFKADDGSDFPDWEEKTLGEVFIEIKEKNRSELPVLSVQQGVGTVLRDSSERRIAYNKNSLNNYKAMRKGDFIIHLRSFEGGLECSNHDGISSPAYRILRSNEILSDAFKDYFRSYTFIKGKLSDSVVGIRDGKNIDMPTFWEIQISIPSLPEQHKIADLLSAVDDVIAAQEAEVAAWEKRKKGVMQKLFSQEVRFKADDGSDFPDWEEQKIEDVCVLNPRTEQLDDEFYYMDLGSIDHGRWEAPEIVNKVDAPSRAQRVAAIDDVFFQSVRPYNMGHYHYVAAKDKQVVASTGYIQARMRNGSNAFLYQLFYEERFNAEVNARCTGSNYPAINSRKFGEITVALPSLPEQRKIADCLSALDDVIIKAKNELAKWQELKKGLLQQMFV